MNLFRCPYCGIETHVDPRFAGQTGPCAGCGKPITVPLPHTRQSSKPDDGDMAPASSRRWRLCLTLAAVTLAILTIGLLARSVALPIARQLRTQSRRTRCFEHMQALLDALQAYHAENGHLPPAYTTDANGRPLHSWRVLLLPYLGPEAKLLYQQLALGEPWDSPQNSMFRTRIPEVYACPTDSSYGKGETSYCAISGTGFPFDKTQTLRLGQITDDLATTLLIVEVADSGINWMEPTDVNAASLSLGSKGQRQALVGSHHGDGSFVLGLANGKAALLSQQTTPDTLLEMATVSGGESPKTPFIK